jgi:hypothetical protein
MSDRGAMKRYLLGRASPEERIDLENKYLSDPGFYEELLETENDLVDSYAKEKLSDADRKEFETHYLSSVQGRKQTQFARALSEIAREPRQRESVEKSPWWEWLTSPFKLHSAKLRWGLAMAAVALLAIAWLRVTKGPNLQVTIPHPAPQEQGGGPQTPPATPPLSNGQAPKAGTNPGTEVAQLDPRELDAFVVQLSPGISRGAGSESKTFAVPKARSITFRLVLDEDEHATYAAVLETAEGHEIKHVGGLKSQLVGGERVVILKLPSSLFRFDDYVIRLNRIVKGGEIEEEAETYSFRVVNR